MLPCLHIGEVANGFIVYPKDTASNDGSQTHVFQTFAELVDYLGIVLQHRENFVIVDSDKT